MRRIRSLSLLLVVGALAAALLGCSSSDTDAASAHPAAKALDRLLQLRVEGSHDASAYADYFEDPALATALAESTASTGTAAVPRWEPPYVSAVGTDTVDVIVRWVASDDFPDWPAATAFILREAGTRWLVIDAVEPADPLPGPVADSKLDAR
ncbi:MAG: hypothetical protein WBI63_08210 [Coriobacteriia bacterium]